MSFISQGLIVNGPRSRDVGRQHSNVFETEIIIHRVVQLLFAAEVTLGGLDRRVCEQKLDLLQFATGLVA